MRPRRKSSMKKFVDKKNRCSRIRSIKHKKTYPNPTTMVSILTRSTNNEGDDEEMDQEEETQQEDDEIVEEDDDEMDVEPEDEPSSKLPAWTKNLESGSKGMPEDGLINNDVSEAAAHLYDNAVMSKVITMFRLYYKQRVTLTPEEYYEMMTENQTSPAGPGRLLPLHRRRPGWQPQATDRAGVGRTLSGEREKELMVRGREDVLRTTKKLDDACHQDFGDL